MFEISILILNSGPIPSIYANIFRSLCTSLLVDLVDKKFLAVEIFASSKSF